MKIKLQSLDEKRDIRRIDPELMRLAASYAKQRTHTELKSRTGTFKQTTLPRMTRDAYLSVFHPDDETIKLPAEPPARDITPFEALGAMLLGVAGSNDDLEDHQVFFILRTVDRPILDIGFVYYEQYRLERLLERMNLVLSMAQRLAIVANVLDLAMSDGYYRSAERRFVRMIRDFLRIDEKSYNEIYQVMMMKHDLGVFN
jgi:hypothetical protein